MRICCGWVVRIVLVFVVIETLAGRLPAAEPAKKESPEDNTAGAPRREVRTGQAKIVDTPAMAAKSKPDEKGWVYAWPASGELVEVRAEPSLKAPVFAEFNGGAIVDLYGKPVVRDNLTWVDASFIGVRGWIPQDRIKPSHENDWFERRWDVHFISPSGKVAVEFRNHSSGDVSVLKDGSGRPAYGLPLDPDNTFQVTDLLLFSENENFFALSYGGPSWGTEVFVYGREGRAPFKLRKVRLQQRCWALALKKGLIPAKATPSHMYMDLEQSLEDGFVVHFAGNYSTPTQNQTDFGPYRFAWHAKGDALTVEK